MLYVCVQIKERRWSEGFRIIKPNGTETKAVPQSSPLWFLKLLGDNKKTKKSRHAQLERRMEGNNQVRKWTTV